MSDQDTCPLGKLKYLGGINMAAPILDRRDLEFMLYELFVGAHPFPDATSAELVVKHLQELS